MYFLNFDKFILQYTLSILFYCIFIAEDEQKNSILEFVEKMQAKLNKKAKGKGIGKQVSEI